MKRVLASLLCLALLAGAAHAQSVDLSQLLPPGQASVSGRIVQYAALLTVLSIAPGLLIMVTSFTRFAVAFSFLRSSIGLQSTPANLVLVSLSLFLTFFVMAPVFDKAWHDGLQPLIDNRIAEADAYDKITTPFRDFMLHNVRQKDLVLFQNLASRVPGAAADADMTSLRIVVPAFMISELRRGFEIGFLIALPFLVIDLVVSTLTMAMGMMMLPPTVISLPLKVLFFVLIDGWNLLAGSLVNSFTPH